MHDIVKFCWFSSRLIHNLQGFLVSTEGRRQSVNATFSYPLGKVCKSAFLLIDDTSGEGLKKQKNYGRLIYNYS